MKQDYVDKQIDAKITEINNNDNVYDVGTVINVKDFIVEVSGMDNVMFYEKINIANKAIGYVNSINESSVTIAVLKIESAINIGDMAYSTNTLYMGAYSPSSIGRVIDLFGEDKLSAKKFDDLRDIPIERRTIPIMDRGTVNRPLLTGIAGIDLMYPIGKGQRQLIIGDKRTGKTQIGLDTIVNQKGKNVLCFYVAIGKTKKEVKNIFQEFAKRGALSYTTIITAFNDELPPVISLIPYFALSVAEDYMMEGYDVLVVIDDLKRHAESYREISLISGKTPGRDAYPADIFYTHSRLLEKGCQHKNGGSITILPIVETKGGDITDYISTNIISITDGQIVLSAKSFQKGEKPAINYGLSVSRLGGAVQEKSMKVVGSSIRRKLLSYLETRSVYELVNMDEMSVELKNQFMEGKFILDNLNQYKFSPRSCEELIATFDDIAGTNLTTSNTDSSTVNNTVGDNVLVESPTDNVVESSVQVETSAPVEEYTQTEVLAENYYQTNEVTDNSQIEVPVTDNYYQTTEVVDNSQIEVPVTENYYQTVEVTDNNQIEVPVTENYYQTVEVTDNNQIEVPVTENYYQTTEVTDNSQIEVPVTDNYYQTTEVTDNSQIEVPVTDNYYQTADVTTDNNQVSEQTESLSFEDTPVIEAAYDVLDTDSEAPVITNVVENSNEETTQTNFDINNFSTNYNAIPVIENAYDVSDISNYSDVEVLDNTKVEA
jgi:F-type H+-transporting ATPase subunit alpha